MKIMQIITLAQLGGAQEVLSQLVNQALKEKHTIILVSQKEGPLWDRFPDDPLLKKYKLASLVGPINPFKDLFTILHLWKIAIKEKPEIIHLHSAKAGFLGRLAFFFMKRRILYTQHGFDSILKAHPKMLALEKLVDSLAYAQVAVSNYDKKLLESVKIRGGIQGIRVIHNGCCAIKRYQKGILTHQNLFEKLRKEGKKIILSISRFETTQTLQGTYCVPQQKNFPLTLKVAQCLGENYQFIWIGNTGKTPHNLPTNMILLGPLKDAKAYLPLADIFLLLSHYEGLPISILEAMSVGTPVLASKVGGVEELIEEGISGFLDQSNKASVISEQLKKALSDPQKLRVIGKMGQEKWGKSFTSQKMYERYRELWEKMQPK